MDNALMQIETDAHGYVLHKEFSVNSPEAIAEADLRLAAAPDLLAACEDALAELEELDEYYRVPEGTPEYEASATKGYVFPAIVKLRIAIARVKGEGS